MIWEIGCSTAFWIEAGTEIVGWAERMRNPSPFPRRQRNELRRSNTAGKERLPVQTATMNCPVLAAWS
jgi:hypothetical protein